MTSAITTVLYWTKPADKKAAYALFERLSASNPDNELNEEEIAVSSLAWFHLEPEVLKQMTRDLLELGIPHMTQAAPFDELVQPGVAIYPRLRWWTPDLGFGSTAQIIEPAAEEDEAEAPTRLTMFVELVLEHEDPPSITYQQICDRFPL